MVVPARIALVAALSLACIGFASPAGARILVASTASVKAVSDAPTLNYAVLSSVFKICPHLLNGAFDLNDTAALADYGLVPDAAADEAELRADVPGMEAARGDYADGQILLAYSSGDACILMVNGDGRLKARELLFSRLAENGASGEVTAEAVGESRMFHLYGVSILVLTNDTTGMVSVSVRKA